MLKIRRFSCTLISGLLFVSATDLKARVDYSIVTHDDTAQISAGILQRTITFKTNCLTTSGLSIAGHDWLAGAARELSFSVSFAQPNQKPKGLKLEESPSAIETTAHFGAGTDSLRVEGSQNESKAGVEWTGEIMVQAISWSSHFGKSGCRVTEPSTDRRLLTIKAEAKENSPLAGLGVKIYYETYNGFPVIRKWVKISNHGKCWLKLSKLVLDDLEYAPDCRHQTPLTPGERGAGPSVVAFGTEDGARGVIAVSEIPSALRYTREDGAMGYAEKYFEWVLGPEEEFVSEPVFLLAYDGEVTRTASAISTPRDRAVESVYLEFLRKHVGIVADQSEIPAPQWCSWSNLAWSLNDPLARELAEIASRAGFAMLLMDGGWQSDGTQPDLRKFPDFEATCRFIQSKGLRLGLWVSAFRNVNSPDLLQISNGRSLPLILRDGVFGMSFASEWRLFYAQDITRLGRRYGASYFKQDLTNIKFGDAAEGHESRTRKESLLRGLRGLLEAQDMIRSNSPNITLELTHEIYWGTPGVPCDVAALKHAATYHIPPNDYAGVGNSKQRVSADWPYDPAKLQQELLAGCFNARQRFYAHRGLPLYCLEYYAAHAVNFRGSLTPEIQDRQICSWLMGAPTVFAGDLASLTEENIKHYRARFDLLRRLEKEYDIYRHFQFSGVPAPTDTSWHWWGKLNNQGAGAVVVVRGTAGESKRAVNIPWVQEDHSYEVTACFRNETLGRFKGRDLQNGLLQLELPPMGQEILELKLVLALKQANSGANE